MPECIVQMPPAPFSFTASVNSYAFLVFGWTRQQAFGCCEARITHILDSGCRDIGDDWFDRGIPIEASCFSRAEAIGAAKETAIALIQLRATLGPIDPAPKTPTPRGASLAPVEWPSSAAQDAPEFPPDGRRIARGAKAIALALWPSGRPGYRRVFHLWNTTNIPFFKEGGTICLDLDEYEIYLATQRKR